MPDDSPLATSLGQLKAAIAALGDAIERREDEDSRRVDLEREMHRVDADRSRLANALDGAEARAARLEAANRDVSRRLVAAMETIREVLERQRRPA